MPLVHATLPAAMIARDPERWTRLQIPIAMGAIGGDDLEVIGADTLSVSAGRLLVLDGLTFGNAACRLTITPDGLGEWTYFHLTIIGGEGTSGYFALAEDGEGALQVRTSTDTAIEGKVKDVSGAPYFWKAIPAPVLGDLTLIMRALVLKDFARGGRPA